MSRKDARVGSRALFVKEFYFLAFTHNDGNPRVALCGIVSLDVVVNVVFQLPLSSSSDVVVATVNDWKIIKEFVSLVGAASYLF